MIKAVLGSVHCRDSLCCVAFLRLMSVISKQWCRITSLSVKALAYLAQFCLLQMSFFYYSYQIIFIVALWEGNWVRKWNTLLFRSGDLLNLWREITARLAGV